MLLLINQVKDAVAVLKLDKIKIASVAERVDAVKWGIVILALPPLINVVLSSLLFPTGFNAIFTKVVFWTMVIPSLSLVATIFSMSFFAERFFKTGNFHWQLFRVLAYASIILWLSPVAFLLDILGIADAERLFNFIWSVGIIGVFVVAYTFLVHQKHLAQKDATLIVLGGVAAYYIFQMILGNVLVGRYYRIFY